MPGGDGGDCYPACETFGVFAYGTSALGSAGQESANCLAGANGQTLFHTVPALVAMLAAPGDTCMMGGGGAGGGGGRYDSALGPDTDVYGGDGGDGGGALILRGGSVHLDANLILSADGSVGGSGDTAATIGSGGGGGGAGGLVVMLYRMLSGAGAISATVDGALGGSGGLDTYDGGHGGTGADGVAVVRRI